MAYQIGAYESLDNTFLEYPRDPWKPCVVEYQPGTLLHYLKTNHPKYFLVIQMAGRLTFLQNLGLKHYTLLIPSEEALGGFDLSHMDRDTALQIFNTHTIEGIFSKDVIMTSNTQTLNTLIPGQPLYVVSVSGRRGTEPVVMINGAARIIDFNMEFAGVLVHMLNNVIPPV